MRIHVTPITWDADRVTDYVAKTYKRGKVSGDDIHILPKTVGELPPK